MEKLSLKAQVRELSNKDLEAARKEGKIPAVVYGRGFANQHLFINDKEYKKIYSKAGESTIINLEIEGKDALGVIIQDQQKHPLTSEPTHIDFYQVRMDEAIETEIEINFVGEPKAVKELGGILVKSRDSLNVKCLPGDLVKEIEANVTELATFDDVMRIKDLDIPEKIEVLDDLNLTIALVTPPRTDAEMEALDEKVDVWIEDSISTKDIAYRLERNLPEGLDISSIQEINISEKSLVSQIKFSDYRVYVLKKNFTQREAKNRIISLLNEKEIIREKRNGKKYDLRKLILVLEFNKINQKKPFVFIRLLSQPNKTGRADEVMFAMGYSIIDFLVERIGSYT